MRRLSSIRIENFKSIRDQTLELGDLNVLIGGNGSGKSNLIEVFRFLRELVGQNLSQFTLRKGGADNLLHFGRARSPFMTVAVRFDEPAFANGYEVRLGGTDEDTLFVEHEKVLFHDKRVHPKPYDRFLQGSGREPEVGRSSDRISAYVRTDLRSYRVYHFHDTSDSARAKGMSKVEDNRFLRPQAENLPSFLYWLQQKEPAHFRLIEDTIRQIAPFFHSFNLEPSRLQPDSIRLEWRDTGSDAYFSASSLSDGTLRFICLSTLLLQPTLPAMILLDEPELGLHPAAIGVLADLLSSAAERTQVLVSTQSVTLVNQFRPDDVWTVERIDDQSVFRHVSESDMSEWLDEYALGDLWEKNILGARP